MPETPYPQPSAPRAHLYLIEVVIALIVLGVAGFFVVRNMQRAKERAQREQITDALNEWEGPHSGSEQETKIAQTIFALVKANPKLHDAKGNRGFTPLHVAAIYGDYDIAQWLLDHGADIHAEENAGWTPLHFAAHHRHKEVTE